MIEKFKENLKKHNLSQNTIDSYIFDIKKFCDYLKTEYNVSIENTNKAMVLTYLVDMQKKGKNASTISRNISAIKKVFNFLIVQRIITNNPAITIHSPKYINKNPIILNDNEIKELMNLPNMNSFKGCRDRAILELLYSSGIKVSELIKLTINNINFNASFMNIDGKKKRILPLGKIAEKNIKLYLDSYRCNNDIEDNSVLFTNMNGKFLTRQGVWKILKSYEYKMSSVENLSPQILRNSFAVHLLNNGADIVTVQELLGHKSIAATEVYLNGLESKTIEVYRKTHPRG